LWRDTAKLARADLKAGIDAMSLIVRTLKKVDQLQRQIARDRELAAEENDAAMGLEDAKNRFLECIDELAEHRARQLLVEWNLTGPPGQGGAVAAADASPVPLLKELIADAGTRLTLISTLANASNLAPGFIDALANRYGVAEINQGGDMVASMLKSIDESLPASTARATRGKYLRAEPVAALTSRACRPCRALCRARGPDVRLRPGRAFIRPFARPAGCAGLGVDGTSAGGTSRTPGEGV